MPSPLRSSSGSDATLSPADGVPGGLEDKEALAQKTRRPLGESLKAPMPRHQQLGLWIIVILCVVLELLPFAADQGWIDPPQWRSRLLQNGAFWIGLLHNWRPNYALQPWSMFVTYGFLHADLWHLIGNMLVLGLFGRMVVARIGQGWFLLVYLISMLGGAAGFALLSHSAQPMVGASGALFGLIGAWQLWHWRDLSRDGASRWPVVRLALWLLALNVVMAVLQQGGVAWQTHLGGYGAGILAARFYSLLYPGRVLS